MCVQTYTHMIWLCKLALPCNEAFENELELELHANMNTTNKNPNEEELNRLFPNYMKRVIILDDLKIEPIVQLAESLGPKFIFPTAQNNKQKEEKIGLLISIQQAINFNNFNHKQNKLQCEKEIEQTFAIHHTPKHTDDNTTTKNTLSQLNTFGSTQSNTKSSTPRTGHNANGIRRR